MAVDDKEVIAKDQKRLIVSAFATYHITDPLVFFQTVRNEEGARTRLAAILDSSLRQILGEVMLTDLLGEQRQKAMRDIRRVMREQARSFGVTVADVRIMRADLPEENSRATYGRMISDRRQQAERYRAEGEEEAVKIIADADKQYQLILADAVRREQMILGAADAEAASIFAKVAQKDSEFFAFFRTLETYRRVLKKEDTTLLLSSENPFLETLTKGK
jgi:membrane protease subunit HflC